MDNTEEWRRTLRHGARTPIMRELENGVRVDLDTIYEAVGTALPELCDPSIPCVHAGVQYSDHEWKHLVRRALQDLQDDGTVMSHGQAIWSLAPGVAVHVSPQD